MAVYVIAMHTVTDAAKHEEYRQRVTSIIERHGGKFLVRSRSVEVMDGDLKPSRVVVIEFADMAAANAVREETKGELTELRRGSAKSVMLRLQGED